MKCQCSLVPRSQTFRQQNATDAASYRPASMAFRSLVASRFRVGGTSSSALRREHHHHHQHRHRNQHQQEPSYPWTRSKTTSAWGGERQQTTAAAATSGAAAAVNVEDSEASASSSRGGADDSNRGATDDGDLTRKFGDPHFWEGEYSSQVKARTGKWVDKDRLLLRLSWFACCPLAADTRVA